MKRQSSRVFHTVSQASLSISVLKTCDDYAAEVENRVRKYQIKSSHGKKQNYFPN